MQSGCAFEVAELEIEIRRAWSIGRQEFVRIVEVALGPGSLLRGVPWRLRCKGIEGRPLVSERSGGGAQPKDPDRHLVALHHLRKYIRTAHGAPKDGVQKIQALDRGERDEELGAVGVGPVVRHGQCPFRVMPKAGSELVGK